MSDRPDAPPATRDEHHDGHTCSDAYFDRQVWTCPTLDQATGRTPPATRDELRQQYQAILASCDPDEFVCNIVNRLMAVRDEELERCLAYADAQLNERDDMIGRLREWSNGQYNRAVSAEQRAETAEVEVEQLKQALGTLERRTMAMANNRAVAREKFSKPRGRYQRGVRDGVDMVLDADRDILGGEQ